jgi:hypothetical protein
MHVDETSAQIKDEHGHAHEWRWPSHSHLVRASSGLIAPLGMNALESEYDEHAQEMTTMKVSNTRYTIVQAQSESIIVFPFRAVSICTFVAAPRSSCSCSLIIAIWNQRYACECA